MVIQTRENFGCAVYAQLKRDQILSTMMLRVEVDDIVQRLRLCSLEGGFAPLELPPITHLVCFFLNSAANFLPRLCRVRLVERFLYVPARKSASTKENKLILRKLLYMTHSYRFCTNTISHEIECKFDTQFSCVILGFLYKSVSLTITHT